MFGAYILLANGFHSYITPERWYVYFRVQYVTIQDKNHENQCNILLDEQLNFRNNPGMVDV